MPHKISKSCLVYILEFISLGQYPLVLSYKGRSAYSTFWGGLFTILAMLTLSVIIVVLFTPVFMHSHYNLDSEGFGIEAYREGVDLVLRANDTYCENGS